MNLLALEFVGNLAQMQRRAGQPVQARHHERIVLPDLLQAGLEPLSPAGSTAFLLLKDLIAAGELVELEDENSFTFYCDCGNEWDGDAHHDEDDDEE